jgi:guanylate kinase
LQKKIRGTLYIVSAPSGAGKTTLCRKLIEKVPDLKFSVSYTTRRPRPGEVNDLDYTFVSRDEFRKLIDQGGFLEWAEVHGELYGTSRKPTETLTENGYDVILDIDTQGAMQLKKEHENGIYIFILPPSFNVLKERLRKRMTDSEAEIGKRLKRAIDEIKTYPAYDYVIINDILEDALREFEAIISCHRARATVIDPLWMEEMFFTREEQ